MAVDEGGRCAKQFMLLPSNGDHTFVRISLLSMKTSDEESVDTVYVLSSVNWERQNPHFTVTKHFNLCCHHQLMMRYQHYDHKLVVT